MQFILEYLWLFLLISFMVTAATTYLMGKQARQFYYLRDTVVLHFSIFDLEFPGSQETIKNILQGIDKLATKPGCEDCLKKSADSKKALKNNLLCDFIFMAGIYPFIALLCIATAYKMTYWGRYIFLGLAILQLVAWLFDILENLYLLNKMKNPDTLSKLYTAYKNIVIAKWIFAVTGLICSLFGLLYFWLRGNYGHTLEFGALGIYFIILLSPLIKK